MARTVTVTATTLFHVAAAQYGDASQWWRIARANQITDPRISGVTTLTIPDPDPSTTGDGLPLDGA
jgi:nucleoid-associated protein YgaU